MLYGNWATDRAVIQACCDQHHCVTLYAPSAQACWIPLFEVVLPTLTKDNALPKNVVEAMQTIRQEMSRLEITEFEKNEATYLRAAAKEGQKGSKFPARREHVFFIWTVGRFAGP